MEKRLEQNLSGEEYVQELVKEVIFTLLVLDDVGKAVVTPSVPEFQSWGSANSLLRKLLSPAMCICEGIAFWIWVSSCFLSQF